MAPDRALDLHVHLAANGEGGHGGWMHPRLRRSLRLRLLHRLAGGLRPPGAPDFTPVFQRRIAGLVREAPGLGGAVLLALDRVYDAAGEADLEATDLYVPNEMPLALAEEADDLYAGVSIHPYRRDALEELRRCRARGAVLVKWLPVSQRFDPCDERCRPFYAELVRLGLPLLCHTGSEAATRQYDRTRNDPRVLLSALEAGVTVIAAHAGMRSLPHDRDHFETWAAMLKDHPRLYGDTAACFALRARTLGRVLGREYVCDRLVHGSDWPMPAGAGWHLGRLPLAHILRLRRIANPLERDLRVKKALGLPEDVFTRGWRLIAPAPRRS